MQNSDSPVDLSSEATVSVNIAQVSNPGVSVECTSTLGLQPCAYDRIRIAVTYEDFTLSTPFLGALIGTKLDISAEVEDAILARLVRRPALARNQAGWEISVHMTGTARRYENGQVMILLVLGFVGLLGFAALAIDIGMLYSDRRIAQNAADAATLAGAGRAGQQLKTLFVDDWDCGSGFNTVKSDAKDTAIEQTLFNQFVITDLWGSPKMLSRLPAVLVAAPAITIWMSACASITQTPSTFSHMIFGGQLANTVEAVARVTPKTPFAGVPPSSP